MNKYLIKKDGSTFINKMFESEEDALGWLACNALRGGARNSKWRILEQITYDGWSIARVTIRVGKSRYFNLNEELPYGR